MIQRQWKKAELFLRIPETGREFGKASKTEKMTDLLIVLTEANAVRTKANETDVILYDAIALTQYCGEISKDMYLVCEGACYEVQYMLNSRRFRQIFMKRVE